MRQLIATLLIFFACYSAVMAETVLLPKTYINNTTIYDAFGDSIKLDSDTILKVFNSGTNFNSTDWDLYGIKYTISTGTWGSPYLIYHDPTYMITDGTLGMIGSTVYLFFQKRESPAVGTPSHGVHYITSNTTATSWSSSTALTLSTGGTYATFHVMVGAFTKTNVAGTYLLAMASSVDGVTNQIHIFKTTDSGATWTDYITIYSTTLAVGEPSLAHIGGGKIICLIRVNNGYMKFAKSSDNGATWTSPSSLTNFPDSTHTKTPIIWYDEDKDDLIISYLNRGTGAADVLYYSIADDPDAAFDDMTTFPAVSALDSDGYSNSQGGYPSMKRLDNDRLIFMWFKRQSNTDADQYYAILSSPIDETPPPDPSTTTTEGFRFE